MKKETFYPPVLDKLLNVIDTEFIDKINQIINNLI